jgi:hypothetical protein
MADLKDKHYHASFFNAANQAVIFHTISPETGQVSPQGLSETSGVVRNSNS